MLSLFLVLSFYSLYSQSELESQVDSQDQVTQDPNTQESEAVDSLTFFSQDSDRSDFIEKLPDLFFLRASYAFRSLNIGLSRFDDSRSIMNYSPNGRGWFGLGGLFFGLGVELALPLPRFFQSDEDRFGETDFFDLQANFYGKKLGFDMAVQDYQGFYVRNPNKFFPDWQSEDPFPQRRDLRSLNLSLNGYYLFNDNYSLRAAFNQAEIQKRSAGTFLLHSGVRYFTIQGDGNILPEFNFQGVDLKESQVFSWSLSPGYAHNFVWKNFFVSAILFLGPDFQWVNYVSDEEHFFDRDIKIFAGLKSSFGYNSDRFFVGCSFAANNNFYDLGGTSLFASATNFRVFGGYRLEKFGILKKELPFKLP